jgi:Ca2+-dependent lipid-binding protein
MNKPQYSTRIIVNELSPVFEERTALLVDANAPKVKEKVSLQVWDSDRLTSDDMIGCVEIEIAGTGSQFEKSHDQLTWAFCRAYEK